jgi:hypothetical protein
MKRIGLVLASVASTVAGSSTASNASAPLLPVSSNSSNPSRAKESLGTICDLPLNAVYPWRFEQRYDRPVFSCKGEPAKDSWSMLNAYRKGGTQNLHWKYTDDDNDAECLVDWTIYSENGQNRLGYIGGRTTTLDSNRKWCAMAVYRSGGVQGKQWEYCYCWDEPTRWPGTK